MKLHLEIQEKKLFRGGVGEGEWWSTPQNLLVN